MASTYKNPPKFDTDMPYERWKNELEVWQLVTELDKDKRALAVTLTLTGRAREAALEVPAKDLNKDGGMVTLLAALDKVFQKEKIDSTYEAYTQFDKFARAEGSSMSDYIIEYERLYKRCLKYEMKLPDAILAFKLLDGSGLDLRERQMAMTACAASALTMTFDNMKSALNRIFADKPSETGSSAISVKPEMALFTSDSRRSRRPSEWSKKSDLPRGTNPLNRFGKRTRCAVCQSVFHWAKDCPNKVSAEEVKIVDSQNKKTTEAGKGLEDWESCNLTLFTENLQPDDFGDNEVLVVEALGTAVLDTACTKTVCGEEWLNNYKTLLSEEEKHSLKVNDSRVGFRFGDGERHYSYQKVTLPATIGDIKCQIEAEVVKVDIPLLLSKPSLKKAGAVVDLKKDRVTLFDKQIQLQCTSGGHYCVSLRPDGVSLPSQQEDCDQVVMAVLQTMGEDERRKAITKLHSQFGHAPAERLWSLLKSAGDVKPEIHQEVSDIVTNCEVCLKFKKPAPKPAAGFPLATKFNETVAVDLHQLEKNLWYLHIIDEFTRYSAGGIIKSKEPKVFAAKFMQLWIAVHGPPKNLYSDNGGEFNNSEVRDMAENFNIEIKNTPAESPWSNGLLERHNQTLTNIMIKVKDEQNCDYETALAWALMAKNSLHSAHGYSSHQLVHGENPNLPSVLVDKPPALEGTTASENIAKHINALHAARKAFTEAECSERIRRALRKNLRPILDNYQTGDKVYYKRLEAKEWKGPGIVLGQDGVVVFVKHGGTYVRVHRNRLRKEKAVLRNIAESDVESTDRETSPLSEDQNSNDIDIEFDEEEICSGPTNMGNEVSVENITNSANTELHVPLDSIAKQVKVGKTVKFKSVDTQETTLARVLSRAGKATGKNRNWFNLEFMIPESKKGNQLSVDLGQVNDLQLVEERTESQDSSVLIVQECIYDHAKLEELENWKRNGVYSAVSDEGQKSVSTRWVCTMKNTAAGPVTKARLVARGFEELDRDQYEKDAPTCGQESLKVILAIMAQKGWKPNSMDIKAAFLQGHPLSRSIYVKPPKEANATGKLWLLKKCVYGLSDASLHWYTKVKKVLLSLGARNSKLDPAVFFWSEDSLKGVLACHVDDFLWAGDLEFEKDIIPRIREAFEVGKEENVAFNYTGLEIKHCGEEGITLQQQKYAQSLEVIDISKSRTLQKDASLDQRESDQLRSKIGQLLWLGRQSRPDIMYDTCMLASNFSKASVKDLLDANKVISRVKESKLVLKFQQLAEPLQLVIFADASFANLPDGGTQGGHLILLMDKTGKFSPICWSSKRIRRIVRSTLAGEMLALSDAIDVGIYLANMYTEIVGGIVQPENLPILCFTDNKSLCDTVRSNKSVSEKRLRLEVANIKDMIENGLIGGIMWVDSNRQLADTLTKKGASPFGLMCCLEQGVIKV